MEYFIIGMIGVWGVVSAFVPNYFISQELMLHIFIFLTILFLCYNYFLSSNYFIFIL
jgi:hypothetical protein